MLTLLIVILIISVIVNCSMDVRNFFIEASLGTFLNDHSTTEGLKTRATGASVNQKATLKSQMEQRQRTRRWERKRRKRHLSDNPLGTPMGGDTSDRGDTHFGNLDNRRSRRSVTPSSSRKTHVNAKVITTNLESVQQERKEEENSAHGDSANGNWANSVSSERSSAITVDGEDVVGAIKFTESLKGEDGGRTRLKRDVTKCRHKSVWIENFVYQPHFSVKWKFSQEDLRDFNQTGYFVNFR